MGNGIAQVFAQSGHPVVLRDLTTDILDRARGRSRRAWGGWPRRARSAPETRTRRWGGHDHHGLRAVAAADLVIEAVVENLEVKRKVFQDLDRRAPGGLIPRHHLVATGRGDRGLNSSSGSRP